jgi:hypothetical protein
MQNDLFEQEKIFSHQDFVKSIFKCIMNNLTNSTFFVSVPEIYDHSLVVQLFHEISVELSDLTLMKQEMQNAFSKKKKQNQSKSVKQEMLNFAKNLISFNNELKDKKLVISIANCAGLLGKKMRFTKLMNRLE